MIGCLTIIFNCVPFCGYLNRLDLVVDRSRRVASASFSLGISLSWPQCWMFRTGPYCPLKPPSYFYLVTSCEQKPNHIIPTTLSLQLRNYICWGQKKKKIIRQKMRRLNQISRTYSFESTKISVWFGACKMRRSNRALITNSKCPLLWHFPYENRVLSQFSETRLDQSFLRLFLPHYCC